MHLVRKQQLRLSMMLRRVLLRRIRMVRLVRPMHIANSVFRWQQQTQRLFRARMPQESR